MTTYCDFDLLTVATKMGGANRPTATAQATPAETSTAKPLQLSKILLRTGPMVLVLTCTGCSSNYPAHDASTTYRYHQISRRLQEAEQACHIQPGIVKVQILENVNESKDIQVRAGCPGTSSEYACLLGYSNKHKWPYHEFPLNVIGCGNGSFE